MDACKSLDGGGWRAPTINELLYFHELFLMEILEFTPGKYWSSTKSDTFYSKRDPDNMQDLIIVNFEETLGIRGFPRSLNKIKTGYANTYFASDCLFRPVRNI